MSQREYAYTILLDPDEESGTYTVTVPALPGIVTQGDSVEDAIAQGREAIQVHLEGLTQDGLPIPEEREHPRVVTVRVAA